MEIKGKSTAEVANKTIEAILEHGTELKRTRGPWALHSVIEKVPVLELRNVTLVVESPSLRWNTKVGEGMCQEFIDYYLGLNPGYVHLTRWSFYNNWRNPKSGLYPYTYGQRIYRDSRPTNQWDACVNKLRQDLTTRHAAVLIWRPKDLEEDFIPCAFEWHFQINEKDELEMTCVMRSQDALRGFFLDLFAYTQFHEIMASELGIPTGAYTHFETNVHIYGADKSSISLPVARDPPTSLLPSSNNNESVKCGALMKEDKSTMLKAVRSWYQSKNIHKFVGLIGHLPDYWRCYLAFQVLDGRRRVGLGSGDSNSWNELSQHLTSSMSWILREKGRL